MRRLITCVENRRYAAKVENFCKEESIQYIDIATPDEFDGDTCLSVITDKHEYIPILTARFKENCKPNVCLITNVKPTENIFYLKETFSFPHLRMLLDNVYHGILLNNYSPALLPQYFHKKYKLFNDFYNIDRIVYALTSELTLFFKFSELEKIRVGIAEMVTNAMEHGNMEISAEEKFQATENGSYYDLLKSKIEDPEIGHRFTLIEILYDGHKIVITITDQGKGFDVSKLPNPADQEHIFKLHGRGVFMTRIYFTEIKYNEKGNQVTLIKELPETGSINK